MPYIQKHEREKAAFFPDNAGQLNYAITKLIVAYWEKTKNYQGANDIVGALDNAKDEFRRRIQHPYEDVKIRENGDVYS